MCIGEENCDVLLFDVTMFIIRLLFERCKNKKLTRNFNFLLRCWIGFALDGIEYLILESMEDNINYQLFKYIFFIYGGFLAYVTLSFCCSGELYMFLCSIVYKSITLWLAISIFTTNTSFKWDEIENHFTSIDSARDFFIAMIVFISFSDICLDIVVLCLKFIAIGYSALCKHGIWYENISDLLCPKRDRHFNRTCFDENRIFQQNP